MGNKGRGTKLPKFFAVDFFCGAGGTTRGLIDAGGYVVAGVDKEGSCRATYERNNVNTTLDCAPAKYLQRDIFEASEEYPEGQGDLLLRELAALLDGYQTAYPKIPLLLAICAPCQPFTQMTKIEMTDERAMARRRDRGLLGQTFKYVQNLSPALILSENVAGIQNASYGGVWQDFEQKLRDRGYVVGSNIVEAARFSIPQSRRRSIMLAVNKIDCLPEAIIDAGTPTERLAVPDDDGTGRVVTVRETLEKFPPLKAGEKHPEVPNHHCAGLSEINLRRIRLVQPGDSNAVFDQNGLSLACHDRLRARTGADGKSMKGSFSDIYTRMAPDRPSPTMTTKCFSISNGRFGHYDMSQDRCISVREAAALQTFPDDYEFIGDSIQATAKMVGNAVPPKLSEFFGNLLVSHLRPDARPYYFPDDTPAQASLFPLAAE